MRDLRFSIIFRFDTKYPQTLHYLEYRRRKMNKMDYKHDYYNAGVDEMLDDIIPSYLGKADAIDEWIDDPIAAEANFVNNEAYNHFDDVSGVILAGRIGSSKTTILNT